MTIAPPRPATRPRRAPRHPSTAPSASSRRARRPGRPARPSWPRARGTSTAAPPATAPAPRWATSSPPARRARAQLPAEYREASDAELHDRIRAAKATLGDRVVVLGHFYQRDEVIEYADFVGRLVPAGQRGADPARCRGHRVLRRALHGRDRRHPVDARAGRDPAQPGRGLLDGRHGRRVERRGVLGAARRGLGDLARPTPTAGCPVIPVTYMNSSAALKGFFGRNGGIVCTSSNAATVLEWAFERGQRVLFFPDQHLGRNTAKAMGVPLEQMPMWNPRKALGGSTRRGAAGRPGHPLARLLLGAQALHRRPDRAGPRRVPGRAGDRAPRVPDGGGRRRRRRRLHGLHRQGHPGRAAPARPSRSAPRSTWSTGWPRSTRSTTIFCLDPVVCPCSTMYRIHPGYLAWVLEELVAGECVNRIMVPDDGGRPGTGRARADARGEAAAP